MIDYLRGFIHDIRASAGVILTCLDPETRNLPIGTPHLDFSDMAYKQAKTILDLILQFQKHVDNQNKNIPTLSSSEIHALLDEFVGTYPGISVRFTCAKELIIHIDACNLRRVINNCVNNALVSGKAPWILLICECEDDLLQIHIKDGGCGMSKHQLDRIGLGYSTTGGGAGTKILIDLLVRAGGTIRWQSIQDVGTCVSIAFKATKLETPAP